MTTVTEDREIDITDITLAGTDVIVRKVRQLRLIDQEHDNANRTAILLAVRASGGSTVSLTSGTFKYTVYDDADKATALATHEETLGSTASVAASADDWFGNVSDVNRRTLGDFGYRKGRFNSVNGVRLTAGTTTDTWYMIAEEQDAQVPADRMDYFKLEWEA